ncbi:MAG: aminotransferase class IV [Candidatus Omnitrophica bacterium]|nr:aminotransferase class IV [Candidatus Omnitrophota bacterium]
MEKKVIFLDGFMIPVTHSWSKMLSPGILSGAGVFETMRSYQGEVFAFEEHLKRLYDGLKTLKMIAPCTKKEMIKYLKASLEANKLKNARIRLMVWKAKEKTRISIAVFPYHPFSKDKYNQGLKAIFSDIRRDEESVTSRIKTVNYLPLLMAQRKAKARGNDEAILLNRKGFVVEGSKSNIFFVKDQKLYTPALKSGCLNGITRQIIIKIAHKMDMDCKEVLVLPDDLIEAKEAFLTNSLMEIMPLTFVQGKMIGSGKAGPVTNKILRAYRKEIRSRLHQI